jgi:hypothetical protein
MFSHEGLPFMSPRRKINLNGRGLVTSQSGATASGGPNVCKTPVPGAPPVPIPYPSKAESKDLTGYDPSVKVGGGFAFTSNAKLKRSRGDEPGTVNGLLSNKRGADVELLTSSGDVKIGGLGVGRHADVTWQNAKNAIGRLGQSSAGDGADVDVEEEEDEEAGLNCEICGDRQHPTPSVEPHGNHLRDYDTNPLARDKNGKLSAQSRTKSLSEYRKSIRDRIRDNYIGKLESQEDGQDIWAGHPWALRPKSLQGHHLIDCAAMSSDNFWAIFCWNFGYDINDKENGAMLPCRRDVACALHLPLHRGPHDTAVTYSEGGKKVRREDAPSLSDEEIAELLKNQKKVRKNSAPRLTVSDFYLCYPDAVIDLISTVRSEARSGNFCRSPKDFIKAMNRLSVLVLSKLEAFLWTLEAEGRKYIAGGEGCCASGCDKEFDKEQKRSEAHQDIIGHAHASKLQHRLAVGY